jgi:hypothetical protein
MPKVGDVETVKVINADGTESTVKFLVVAVAGQQAPAVPVPEEQ